MSAAPHLVRRSLPIWRLQAAARSSARAFARSYHALPTRSASTLLAASLRSRQSGLSHRFQQLRRQSHESFIEEDTIYALATPAGTSAIAVVRISGPECTKVYRALCPDRPLPKPRVATLRTLYDPSLPATSDSILDPGALLLHFPAPRTVTGDDVLELHIHGGPATVIAVLSAIPRCGTSTTATATTANSTPAGARNGIRYAEPGEFTRRAFLNARLSLPQVEALSATLTAQTEQQRRVAARGAAPKLSALYESWRALLLNARGELEALIDFSEDQHFDESPLELADNVARLVARLRDQVGAHRENAVRGELLRDGVSVALLGAPNAGKSSLLNRIVGREAAIVSREAGTTRDVVEVGVDLGGWLVNLGDTAGLRRGGADAAGRVEVGDVEREGIRRAKDRAARSDVVVVLLPVEATGRGDELALSIDSDVVETAGQCLAKGAEVLVAVNKVDKAVTAAGRLCEEQVSGWRQQVQKWMAVPAEQIFTISCEAPEPDATPSPFGGQNRQTHHDGSIQQLVHGLTAAFTRLTQPIIPDQAVAASERTSTDGEQQQLPPDMSIWQDSLGASQRQRLLLEDCMFHLDAFLAQTRAPDGGAGGEGGFDIAVAAESLRAAADCLAKITGRGGGGDVEEVLGVVFEKFCVGK